MADKRYGLRLTLPGAPNTPHVVAGLPGYYRPDVPTPVGEGCAVSAEQAREAAERIDSVELVEIPAAKVEQAKNVAERDVQEGARGVVDALRDNPDGAEPPRVEDERRAVKAAQEKQE